MALAEADGKVLFGQREGALGGSGTRHLPHPPELKNVRVPLSSARTTAEPTGEEARHVYDAHLVGPTLGIGWEGATDSCSTTAVKRVETQRDATGLHVP